VLSAAVARTAAACIDVRFADGTLVPNEPKAHFIAA
jgi:hypothetical protein